MMTIFSLRTYAFKFATFATCLRLSTCEKVETVKLTNFYAKVRLWQRTTTMAWQWHLTIWRATTASKSNNLKSSSNVTIHSRLQAEPIANISDLLREGIRHRVKTPINCFKSWHSLEHVCCSVSTGTAWPRHDPCAPSYYNRAVNFVDASSANACPPC